MLSKKNKLYLSIAIVVIVCLSIGIHVFQTLSDIDKKNLTSEFHELFWHTSKFQIDILNFKLALLDYEKNTVHIFNIGFYSWLQLYFSN